MIYYIYSYYSDDEDRCIMFKRYRSESREDIIDVDFAPDNITITDYEFFCDTRPINGKRNIRIY